MFRRAQCVLKIQMHSIVLFFFSFTFWCFCCCFCSHCCCIQTAQHPVCCSIVKTIPCTVHTEAGFIIENRRKKNPVKLPSFTWKVTRKCQPNGKSIKITIQWICVCMEYRALPRKIRNRIALYPLSHCIELWHRLTVYRRFANIMWNCGNARSLLVRIEYGDSWARAHAHVFRLF